ncbi:flagella basal body P-ring formation protein FlgA [Helicobacter sp. MIT 00-7814]|uniref:flagellar basal body P-ring formation chaperone FlgA n=1 Tax=unclassified Helicobacter TaxID=2593540 RepID=UPI000E1E5C02|nr:MULTISPECIES: flagellar basal body P-ring formation chaperone FlgA [unclassified Helicobacter]RDU55545.1 flagella basal body P-ring formation protein FlgA [Helicobacter sp. MIT 99-10781]RDU55635.1 flagella basal body P-ring formation protein FlgA [Helicobacter sp. MIT 00-7814]
MFFKKLFLFCALICVFYADELAQFPTKQEFSLAKSYVVEDSKIYAHTLFPEIQKRFLLAVIPQDSLNLIMPSFEVARIFERNGYKLQTPFKEVLFTYQASLKLQKPREFLQKLYTDFFNANCPQSLRVDSIKFSNLEELQGVDFTNADFELFGKSSALKKSSGTLVAKFPQDKKKIFLQYEVHAFVKILSTTRNVSAGEELQDSIFAQEVAFERFSALPACESDLTLASAKVYLAKGSFVSKDKLRPKILVKKGEFVLVQSEGEGFSMQNSLEALQNGSFGEVINAKNTQSGKVVRVKITNKNKGVLL